MTEQTITKMPQPPFRGMMPIMVTAITKSGELDEVSQRRHVQYCLKCGAVAIGHFGFASEAFKISDTDRRRLIKMIVDEVSGRVPVFIGVTGSSTSIAVNYAQEAEALGADLIMAGPPYMSRANAKGLYSYFKEILDTVSIPIIIQDTSVSAGTLTPELLNRMYSEIAHLHYIKVEGIRFVQKSAALIELMGEKMPVIGGAGGKHLIHMLRVGVTAFMTGTSALDFHAAAVNAYLEGDEEKAAQIYYQQILPYLMFYLEYPEQLMKQMLHSRGVIDCPKAIPPAGSGPMSEVERREFEWVLERIGWYNKHWPDIP